MSNPSTSSAAPAGETASINADGASTGSYGLHDGQVESQARRLAPERRRRRRSRKKRSPGLKKKLEFVTHLLEGLDTLVIAELSALYYMECSLFRFVIRGLGHLMYISPKEETFPYLMPASRMHVLLVVLPNLWCMLVHSFAALPQGTDYHRGYMHGGMIIDFVGQKPPAYRIYYLLADLMIVVLQCFMLTVHTERERLRLSLKTFRPPIADAALEASAARTIEGIDAEEQGIRNSAPSLANPADESGEIELQPLRSPTGNEGTEESEFQPGEDVSRTRLWEILSSGNAILDDYHILRSIRVAAMELEMSTAQSLQSIGYRATVAALEAQQRGATAHSWSEQSRRDT